MKILNLSNNYHNSKLWRNMQNEYEKLYPHSASFVSFNHCKKIFESEPGVYDYPILTQSDSLFYFKKIRKCYRALSKSHGLLESIDFIHAHTLFSDGGVAYEIWKNYNIPYCLSVRNTDINVFYHFKPYLKPYAEKILVNSKFVVCLSVPYKNYLLNNIHCKEIRSLVEEKIKIIPNGIDDFWFSNQPECKKESLGKRLTIATVGQISKLKNQTIVVKACEMLRSKGYDVTYHVIGDIVDKEYAKGLNGKDYIILHGAKSKEWICHFYDVCDVMVLPSIHETFGLVYAEALSRGVPVIYTKGQGFDGQFPDGLVGYGVDADDSLELANKIITVKNELPRLSQNALDSCTKFQMSKVVANFYDLITSS